MDKAGDLLKQVFENFDIGEQGETYIKFFSSWTKIVGFDLASHTNVSDIRNGSIIVEVDHPGWMQLMQMKQKSILFKVKKNFPELEIKTMTIKLVKKNNWKRINKDNHGNERKPESSVDTIKNKNIEINDEKLSSALERLKMEIDAAEENK
ncbi:MAG: DUF721 domain-containing protein [Cyclobacteriaceae bacterium]